MSVPYSMTVEQDVGGKVRRIPGPPVGAAGHDGFRSSIMAYPQSGSVNWREARRDPETGLWTVHDCHRAGIEGGATEHRIAARALCFFDALHNVAKFQTVEMQGAAPADELCPPDMPVLAQPLYTAAAKAAKQPVGLDGMPAPAARGEILVSGTFTDDALTLAAQTGHLALAFEARGGMDVRLPSLMDKRLALLPKGEAGDVLLPTAAQLSVRRDFNVAVAAAEEFSKCFSRCSIYDEFDLKYDTFGCFSLMLMTAGLAHPVGLMMGIKGFSLRNYLERRAPVQMQKKIDKLPDGPEKKLLEDFRQAAQFSFHTAYASHLYNKYKNELNVRKRDAGLKQIEKAVAVAGLADDDALRLKHQYLNGKMESPQDIAARQSRDFKTLKENLRHVLG